MAAKCPRGAKVIFKESGGRFPAAVLRVRSKTVNVINYPSGHKFTGREERRARRVLCGGLKRRKR